MEVFTPEKILFEKLHTLFIEKYKWVFPPSSPIKVFLSDKNCCSLKDDSIEIDVRWNQNILQALLDYGYMMSIVFIGILGKYNFRTQMVSTLCAWVMVQQVPFVTSVYFTEAYQKLIQGLEKQLLTNITVEKDRMDMRQSKIDFFEADKNLDFDLQKKFYFLFEATEAEELMYTVPYYDDDFEVWRKNCLEGEVTNVKSIDKLESLYKPPFLLTEAVDKEKACNVCQTYTSTHAFIPCGHMIICELCVHKCKNQQSQAKCPLCRQNYSSIVKIYT